LDTVDWERDTLTDHAVTPRLLLLVTTNQRRGAEVFGEQLAAGLTRRGWDVSLRSLVRADGPNVSARPLVDKDRAELGGLDRDVASAVRKAARDVDLVFANGSATLRYGLATRLMWSRPKLIYGSIGEPLAWSVNPLTRIRTAAQLRLTDLITAVSAPTRLQIVSGLRISGDDVVVAPTGVDASFADIESLPSESRLRLLLLGSVTEEKGPEIAVRAVRVVSRDHPVELRVVGTGDLVEPLRESLAPGDPIVFTGPTDDVRPHLAWADVLLLTSRTEGLPGVVMEAAAAGVPALAFDVGGVSDIVTGGVTGMLVPRGDETAFTSALADLAGARGEIAAMGAAARARVLGGFTLEHAFDRYDEVFRSVLAGRRPKTLGEV
jgi:glycosyltransferase involved in cell wall biosynthesis